MYLYLKVQSEYVVHGGNLRLVEWGVLGVCYLLTGLDFFFAMSLFFPYEIGLGTAWGLGWALEQPGLVRGVPVHGRVAGTR